MEGENSVDIYADLLEDNIPTETQEPVPLEKVPTVACSVSETAVGSVDESSRLTALDLYDDLITDEGVQNQVSLQELSDRYQKALNTVSDLEQQLQTARNHERFYTEKSKTLEKNISLLYVTAKAELQRKDTQIEELREKLKYSSLRWKPGCSRFHRKDFLSEEGHARSNGHSASIGTSERDIHRESNISPRKRKIVSSWDDLKENFKRQKRDEPRYVAVDASSSKGLHIYSEKSRDGLISARKLVEKSIKDLRNRRSNEYKRSIKEQSESVSEGELPVEGNCNVISKSDPSGSLTTSQHNENKSESKKMSGTEDNKSVLTFKGLIDSHTEHAEVEKSKREKLSSEQVIDSHTEEVKTQVEKLSSEQVCQTPDSPSGGVSQLISKDKYTEHSPFRSRKETSSVKDKHRMYSEKKKSSKYERPSHARRKLDEKEITATSQSKVSSISADSSQRRTSEHSRRNSKIVKDNELKRDTEERAKSNDLRFKLQQKKRLRSSERRQKTSPDNKKKEIPTEQKDTKNIKRYKLDRTESEQKDKFLERFPNRKPSSQKSDEIQVQEKPQDSTSDIEKVWSLVNSESSEYLQKSSSNNFQNVSDKKESESTDHKAERYPDTSWNKKKPLTPKQSSRRFDKVNISEVSNVEEAMIRVNEEKISMYSKASNKEVEALSNKPLSALNKDISQADREDPTEGLSLSKSQGENNPGEIIQASSEKRNSKLPPRSQDNKYCTADGKDAANVFIEELISIDQRNENFFSGEKDHDLGATPSKSVSPEHSVENESKNEECYKKSLTDVHESSLSCFDIKIHVSETELNDLLGNEDSLSGGVMSKQPSHQKKEIVKDLKVSSRDQSKYSSRMDASRNNKKKINTTEKEGNRSLSQGNEPGRSKAVLKLPLGPKQVFSESIVFENTQKPKVLSEKVFTSCKGTKIVMKSEALKAEEKKPVSKNSFSKKEYDADREFLNQLKTKYSKEQSKICQKSKDGLKNNQSNTAELSKLCIKQKDDLKVSEVETGSELKKKSGFPKIFSACIVENTEKHRDSADKIKDGKTSLSTCTFEHQDQGLNQNTLSINEKCEEENKTICDEENISNNEVDNSFEEEVTKEQNCTRSKESILKIGNITETLNGKSMAKVTKSFLGENSSSTKTNDLDNISLENYKASESTPTTGMGIDDPSFRETIKEKAVALEHPPVLSSAVSIDFIRNSIIKKIEEKSQVCDDTNTVSKSVSFITNEVTDNGLQEQAPEKTMPVENLVITNNMELNTSKMSKVQDVQSFTMPTSPDRQKMDNICREVLTETESITEFFDDESQLDLKSAVSLRAKDGINVRRQSFEKQNEDKESDENNCSPVEEMNFDVVEAFETENNTGTPLRDSEPEEGEVHSSDSENEDQKGKEKVMGAKKFRSLSNASDKEPGSRNRYSSSHRSKSESKEKYKKDRVEDNSRRSGSEAERSLKPKTPRRDSERKYDPKQDRKDRESRSKEKSSSFSSSRERKIDDRRRENDSKHLISGRHSRTRVEEVNRHKSSETISDKREKSRRDATETKGDRHSRSRYNSVETKSDRHPRKLHDSSDTKSMHRSSSKLSRDSHKSSTKRK